MLRQPDVADPNCSAKHIYSILLADLIADPRFATREARGQHEAEIDQILSDWTRCHVKHEAMRLIGGAGVPAGAVLDTGDLLGARSFEKRAIIQTMRRATASSACRLSPVRFDGVPAPVRPAPLLGEHTAEVFGEWPGMSADGFDTLRMEGVV